MSFGATPKSPAPEWMSLKNLLRIASKNDPRELPTVESERAEHANKVLQSKLGCDLLLNSHGLIFPIHSAWALGGPNADWMLKCLFQGTPEHPVEIPFPGFSPIVVDRFVNFLYLHKYKRNIETEVSNIAHAENRPNSPYIDFTRDMKSVRFNLEMVRFAEFLEYPALINAVYAKLIEQLLCRAGFPPMAMKDFVEWTYGAGKICEDKEGSLKHLMVAATFVHGGKSWEQEQRDEFVGLVQHQEGFVNDMAAAELEALQKAGKSS